MKGMGDGLGLGNLNHVSAGCSRHESLEAGGVGLIPEGECGKADERFRKFCSGMVKNVMTGGELR